MNKYSIGQVSKIANVSTKTLRYYDEYGLFKPSIVDENNKRRYYLEKDILKLQEILFLKYLGFSLHEIKEITIHNEDKNYLKNSLSLQLRLLNEKINQMQMIKTILSKSLLSVQSENPEDWLSLFENIDTIELNEKLKEQYQNSNNIIFRTSLHQMYSKNPVSWFEWIYSFYDLKEEDQVLELGCGNGTFWKENYNLLPKKLNVKLTDISIGMIHEVKENFEKDSRFSFEVLDADLFEGNEIKYDIIGANHLLFYVNDLNHFLKEVSRSLKKGGKFICSTYGKNHMKEIRELVQEFDSRIVLSASNLYEVFGKENGMELLKEHFDKVKWVDYEDDLFVDNPDDLISYILSCHGNQNRYIIDRFGEFKDFIMEKADGGIHISKEAGIFICST